MNTAKLDRKGILSFLAITFAVTYTIEGALLLSGFRVTQFPAMYGQLVVSAVMWAPALAAVLTIRCITHEGFAGTNVRLGAWRPYLKVAWLLPACFALIYLLTWLLGLGRPDWQLAQFLASLGAVAGSAPALPAPPALILLALFGMTLVVSPFVNTLFAFGEELGWRGYLLPKLMALGKIKAYLLLGLIWSLWHLPLVLTGFTYPGTPVIGFFAFTALTTAFGIYLNELTLRHKSSVLAAWGHGVFNSQKLGIWALVFPAVNPLLGGFAGAIGILVWLALGLWQMRHDGHSV